MVTKPAVIYRNICHPFNEDDLKNMFNQRRNRFATHNKWNGEVSEIDENSEEIEGESPYENYAKERLERPEFHRIRIGLERLRRSLSTIAGSWQRTDRNHAQKELGNILSRQHEIENEAENIEDMYLREYIYEQLDIAAAARRSLAEEIKWDIEAVRRSQGIK